MLLLAHHRRQAWLIGLCSIAAYARGAAHGKVGSTKKRALAGWRLKSRLDGGSRRREVGLRRLPFARPQRAERQQPGWATQARL